MRILITGGAGYIGSHLADVLIDAEHQVTALDNLSTGRITNISHLLDHTRFRLKIQIKLQKAILNQGFTAFCRWAAEQKGLTDLIAKTSFKDFESIGQTRYQQVQKLEAISQLFRPALEYWLVLDRAMYLEENGYHVEIGEFCDKSLTPRNWMIRAER